MSHSLTLCYVCLGSEGKRITQVHTGLQTVSVIEPTAAIKANKQQISGDYIPTTSESEVLPLKV